MRNSFYATLFLVAISWSCHSPKIKGYTILESGLEYKLYVLGDGEVHPTDTHLIVPSLSVYDSNNALVYTNLGWEVLDTMRVNPGTKGGLDEGLQLLYEGDSASFLVSSAYALKWDSSIHSTWVRVEVGINAIIGQNELKSHVAFPEFYESLAKNEQEHIMAFVDSIKTKHSVVPINGMYYAIEKKGNGRKPIRGEEITIDYEGFFFNGEKFDSSLDRKEPLSFTLGEQGQVIKGFDVGLRQLSKGSEAIFIIPSTLAFSKTGSSTGLIPPYTPLLYKVRLHE